MDTVALAVSGANLMLTPLFMVVEFKAKLEEAVLRRVSATKSVPFLLKVPPPRVRVFKTTMSSLKTGGVSLGAGQEAIFPILPPSNMLVPVMPVQVMPSEE